ncbi:unnamed protein product, partial [Staurois parvus]
SCEWTPVPRDTQRRSPCTSSENAACTGTSAPSMVAFSSASSVPLELKAPTHGSSFLCAGGADARILVWIRSCTTPTDVNLA